MGKARAAVIKLCHRLPRSDRSCYVASRNAWLPLLYPYLNFISQIILICKEDDRIRPPFARVEFGSKKKTNLMPCNVRGSACARSGASSPSHQQSLIDIKHPRRGATSRLSVYPPRPNTHDLLAIRMADFPLADQRGCALVPLDRLLFLLT